MGAVDLCRTGSISNTFGEQLGGLSKPQPPFQQMARLPLEVFATVVEYAPRNTLLHLLLVSRAIYSVTTPVLYASIPNLSMTRTIRCLLTLSARPELASMIRSFRLDSPFSDALGAFHSLLGCAFSNMTGLRILSIQPYVPITGALNRLPCQLKELLYTTTSDNSYPISRFLSTQQTIETLTIVCSLRSLSGLEPDALPALRELFAPICSIQGLPLSQIPHLSRLCIVGAISLEDLFQLTVALSTVKHIESLELIIGIDTTTNPTIIEEVSLGLACVGLAAPFVTSPILIIRRGYVLQNELHKIFAFALPNFPNLRILSISSKTQTPYIRNFQTQSAAEFQEAMSLVYAMCQRAPNFSAVSPFLLLISTHTPPILQPELNLTHDPSSPIHDALYDELYHQKILPVWSQIHPGLEWVVFPVGKYNLAKLRSG